MNLILLEPAELDDRGCANLTGVRAEHISQVLKADVGSTLRIGVVNGPLGSAEVLKGDREGVSLQCTLDEDAPPRPQVDLLLAMPRPKVMKRLWAQLAALGVGRIVLVNAEKVERFYFDSHAVDPEYYRARLIEGLQQARCTHLPEVCVRQRFKPFVEDELEAMFVDHVKLLVDPTGKRRLADIPLAKGKTALAIGPEGGWTEYELRKLGGKGFECVGMGNRILRSDTACIAAVSLVEQRMRE